MKIKALIRFDELEGISYNDMELVMNAIGFEFDDSDTSGSYQEYYYTNDDDIIISFKVDENNNCFDFKKEE